MKKMTKKINKNIGEGRSAEAKKKTYPRITPGKAKVPPYAKKKFHEKNNEK